MSWDQGEEITAGPPHQEGDHSLRPQGVTPQTPSRPGWSADSYTQGAEYHSPPGWRHLQEDQTLLPVWRPPSEEMLQLKP